MIRFAFIALAGIWLLGCSHRLDEQHSGINQDGESDYSRSRKCRNPDSELRYPRCNKENSPANSEAPVPMPPYGNRNPTLTNEWLKEFCKEDEDCLESFAIEPKTE